MAKYLSFTSYILQAKSSLIILALTNKAVGQVVSMDPGMQKYCTPSVQCLFEHLSLCTQTSVEITKLPLPLQTLVSYNLGSAWHREVLSGEVQETSLLFSSSLLTKIILLFAWSHALANFFF